MPTKPADSKKKKTVKVTKPRNIAAQQKKAIEKRGGTVTYKRDGNLPVGIY
jgi:hypothetical protein